MSTIQKQKEYIKIKLDGKGNFSKDDIKNIFKFVRTEIGTELLKIQYVKDEKRSFNEDVYYTHTLGSTKIYFRCNLKNKKGWGSNENYFEFVINHNKSGMSFGRMMLTTKNPQRIKQICIRYLSKFHEYIAILKNQAEKEEEQNKEARSKIEDLGIKDLPKCYTKGTSWTDGRVAKKQVKLDLRTWENKKKKDKTYGVEVKYVKKDEVTKLIKAIEKCKLTVVNDDNKTIRD